MLNTMQRKPRTQYLRLPDLAYGFSLQFWLDSQPQCIEVYLQSGKEWCVFEASVTLAGYKSGTHPCLVRSCLEKKRNLPPFVLSALSHCKYL